MRPAKPLLTLRMLGKSPVSHLALDTVEGLLEPVLHLRAISAQYEVFRERQRALPGSFFDHALAALDLDVRVTDEDLARIPPEGPVVLVANHPFGAVDGIALGQQILRVREDMQLMVNHLLDHFEGIDPWLIKVDAFGGQDAAKRNLAPMKAALRHLRQAGVLLTWPAGVVSHLHLRRRQVTDPPWVPHLARIIRRSGATVVPVYFPGRNSALFQLLGLIHPRLRTALLPREMWRRRGRPVELRIGQPLPPRRLAEFPEDRQLMDFLRLRTYVLQSRAVAEKTTFFPSIARQRKEKAGAALPAATPPETLEREMAALPPESLLVSQGEYRVYNAAAAQIPEILRELGRLREITFRTVGEGTGAERDLDRFDAHYRHLFMWHVGEREIVGAYRLGLSDEILRDHGPKGLYTTTLFRYQPGVLERFSPAIELGRSFIVAAYQRKHASLGLIWRGIGEFIARHPRYKVLFGPVSISKEYQSLSKNLMMVYLREHSTDPDLAKLVRAKRPPRTRFFGRLDKTSFRSAVRDIDDVSALISEIEREDRGVPVLLRQYLKFNATVLSFNVDPDFSDCVDGLVLTDLTKAEPKILARYMSKAGAAAFFAFHEENVAAER